VQVEVGSRGRDRRRQSLTPELALAAAKLVTTGKTYSLAVETNAKTPAFGPRSWALAVNQPGQVGGVGLGPTKTN
jgi:hypothetical protein